MKRPFVDYYAALGLGVGASVLAIQTAYKRRAWGCHPDRHPDLQDATERMQQLNAARESLVDPARRARYDLVWRRHQTATSPRSSIRWAWVGALRQRSAGLRVRTKLRREARVQARKARSERRAERRAERQALRRARHRAR